MSELWASGGTANGADVVPLLERCWGSVAVVAKRLFTHGEVTHADVCRALSIPPTDHGYHRSLILAGSAPGSFTVTRQGQQ